MNIKLLVLCYLVHNIVCTDNSKQSLDVTTSSGVVRGQTLHILNKNVNQYLNIPFAEPPVGRLRFAKPVPLKVAKNDIIDGKNPGYSCIQNLPPGYEELFAGLNQNEDCLVLNVWSPDHSLTDNTGNNNQLKPVMFWIYGGGLSMGSIFQDMYNGSVLAATGDVVIVAANYRVGALGFLYGADNSAPGNVGLYDQLLALKWVRDNAQAFGGDRDRITIFGESAGSMSVSAHVLSPLSSGQFRRAIMFSGSVMYNKDRPIIDTIEALEKSKQKAKELGCDPYDYHWLDCLRDISDPKLFKDPPVSNGLSSSIFPVIGTEFLPQLPQKAFELGQVNTDIDILSGTTTHEGLSMALMLFPETMGSQLTVEQFTTILAKVDQSFHNLDIANITKYYLNNVDTTSVHDMRMALGDLMGDLFMVCPTFKFAKTFAQNSRNNNVYYYQLQYKAENSLSAPLDKALGLDASVVHHGSDIEFIFGIPLLKPEGYSELDYDFSLHVMQLISNFAKYGKPDNDWPKLLDTNSKDSIIVTKIRALTPHDLTSIIDNPFDSTCGDVWKYYF